MNQITTMALLGAAAAAAFTAQAQQPAPPQPKPYYARAIYTRWKPGMQAEGQRFVKDVPYKASLNWLRQDPNAVGQITMSRVLPGGNEAGYDRLRLVITSAPPDLGGANQPGSPQYLEGTGMSQADYSAKLRSMMDTVRTEVWRSVFRHGSIKQGSYLVVTTEKPPAGKTTENLAYLRDWEGGMYAEIVKSGRTTSIEEWQLLVVGGEYPYTFVRLAAFPDSDSVLQGYGNRAELFAKAHPGKSYYTYRKMADEVGHTVQQITYRVDLAVWK